MDEADGKLEEMHEERWDEVLPLFLESDESTAQQIFPLMERAIENRVRLSRWFDVMKARESFTTAIQNLLPEKAVAGFKAAGEAALRGVTIT